MYYTAQDNDFIRLTDKADDMESRIDLIQNRLAEMEAILKNTNEKIDQLSKRFNSTFKRWDTHWQVVVYVPPLTFEL